MDDPILIHLDVSWTVIVAVVVLYVGRFLTARIHATPDSFAGVVSCERGPFRNMA